MQILSRLLRTAMAVAIALGAFGSRDVSAQDGPPAPERGPRQIIDEAFLAVQAELAQERPAEAEPLEGVASVAIKLTFQSFRDGNWEIYFMAEDGSGLVRLTSDPTADLEPSLSPDASQVVFTSRRTGNYELFVINTDGTGLRQLTNHPGVDGSPSWSPDGRRIAFASDRDGNAEIYVVNVDGSGLTRLTNAPGFDDEPDWSPDGRQIAFTSRRSAGPGDYFIWVMNADGSGVRQVSNLLYSENPAWWTDGRRIVFDASPGSDWQRPWIINADGSNAAPLGNWGFGQYFDMLMGDAGRTPSSAYMTLVTYQPQNNRLVISNLSIHLVDWVSNQAPLAVGGTLNAAPKFESTDRVPPVSRVLSFQRRISGSSNPYPVLRVMATDQGPVDRGRIDVQIRRAGTSTWDGLQGAFVSMGSGSAAFWSVPIYDRPFEQGRIRYEARVRAMDGAGNLEAWPADGQPSFAFDLYTRMLSGQVTDSQGNPIEGATVRLPGSVEGTVHTDSSGRYLFLIWSLPPDAGVSVETPGSAPIASLLPWSGGDQTLDLRVPTSFDLVNNGTFSGTQPSAEWSRIGHIPISTLPLRTPPQTGEPPATNWLSLGWFSRDQIVMDVVPTSYEPRRWQVAYTAQGKYVFGQSAGGAVVLYCPTQQVCQAPVALSQLPFSRAGLGTDGAWYVLAGARPSAGYTLLRWVPGNAPTILNDRLNWQGGGVFEKLVFDPGGQLHWMWVEPSGGVHHAVRSTTGTWSGGSMVAISPYGGDALVDPSGRLHLLTCHAGGVDHFTWTSGGGWSAPVAVQLATCSSASEMRLSRLIDGRLFASWSANGRQQLGLLGTNPDATWQVQAVPGFQGACTAGIWPSENDQLACFSQSTITNLVLTGFDPVGGAGLSRILGDYLQPTASANSARVPGYSDQTNEVALNAGDSLRVVNIAATTSGQGGVSQVIDLTGVLGRPILSFAYALPSSSVSADDLLSLSLQATGAPTATVIPLEPSAYMQTRQVDLTAWSGQSMRLSFLITDSINITSITGQIGDVHVNDVRTPMVNAVTATDQTLTITGMNFQVGVSVSIGGQAAAAVTRVDAGTLTAQVPSGLSVGRHRVQILNPDGSLASRLVDYRVNTLVFLPTIRNWADPAE